MTTERLNKLSKEKLIELVLVLNKTTELKIRAKKAFAKQIDDITNLLETAELATENSMSEKDEKKWERGRTLLKDLPSLMIELDRMEERLIPVSKDLGKFMKISSPKSIESMQSGEEDQNEE